MCQLYWELRGKWQTVLQGDCAISEFHQHCMRISPYPPQHLALFVLLMVSIPVCEVRWHCGFALHCLVANDIEH